MRTACTLPWGVSVTETPRTETPPGQTGSDIIQRPPPPPWTEWLTHACENITLPQTSFAGGKYASIHSPSLVTSVCSWCWTGSICLAEVWVRCRAGSLEVTCCSCGGWCPSAAEMGRMGRLENNFVNFEMWFVPLIHWVPLTSSVTTSTRLNEQMSLHQINWLQC